MPERPSIQSFNEIDDLRLYLCHHPDHEMVRTACLHFLGDKFQEYDLKLKQEKDNGKNAHR